MKKRLLAAFLCFSMLSGSMPVMAAETDAANLTGGGRSLF